MRIALFCTGNLPVPPQNYGGVQMQNFVAAEGLVKLGHDVTVFAPKGSKLKRAKLVEIEQGWGSRVEYSNFETFVRPHLSKFDILIDTSSCGCPGHLEKEFPYVARMGGDPTKRYCANFDRNIIWPSWIHFRFHDQGDCGCSVRREELRDTKFFIDPPVIPKPVCYQKTTENPSELPLHQGHIGEPYLLYVGLYADHKAPHLAMDLANTLKHKLIMIGLPDQSPYYQQEIEPRITQYIDMRPPYSFDEKWDLMANARAVVFPSVCCEGDPNVPKEYLLVGTPVIGFDGTLEEIVENKKTGVICGGLEEMISRINEVDRIDPYTCREKVLKNFSLDSYIEGTLSALKNTIEG